MHYHLPHTIQHSAENFPQKEAFRAGKQSISYQELFEKTNQLAHKLIDLGVQRGDRVGVFMNRCLDTAIAIYGIMRAGAAYVPIDPFAPANRARFLIKDCGIEVLVTNKGQRRALGKVLAEENNLKHILGYIPPVPLKGEPMLQNLPDNAKSEGFPFRGTGGKTYTPWSQIFQLPKTPPNIPILEDDLAYILYTSGSTGSPKGIMHSHRSGLAYAKLVADLHNVQNSDIVGNHAPLHFDISTFGYFAAPLKGATTVIASDAHTKMPTSLAKLIADEKITIWYSVPLALIQMLRLDILEELDFSALRWVLFAGEPFPTKHLRTLMKIWSQAKFCNAYGPTETNVCTNYILPEIPENDDALPIGEVWGNTEKLILDTDNERVKKGESGELLIRSATLMKGYWNRSDLTNTSFFHRETVPNCKETFYRTGDLVREMPDGNLEFLGRKDRQIKTKGYRVELDEITNVLLSNEKVTEAAVYPFENENGETLIAASIILTIKNELSDKDLQNYVGQFLPKYAVPHKINITENFPRTSTGKIDLKKLSSSKR